MRVTRDGPGIKLAVAEIHDDRGEARAALIRGEPDRALTLARATRRLPARVLEPEELGLEVRALRALERADEALATELTLRKRFPNHALSRY